MTIFDYMLMLMGYEVLKFLFVLGLTGLVLYLYYKK